MIRIEHLTDCPFVSGQRRKLLSDVNLFVPNGRYALLSSTPQFRKPVIDLLGGTRPPLRGTVTTVGRSSWPLGRKGFLRARVTGYQMIRLIASLYHLDVGLAEEFIIDILDEPSLLRERLDHWPVIATQEFSYALAILPTFDIYLIDGFMPRNATRFSRLWQALFEERTAGKTLIFSGIREGQISDYCLSALILDNGALWIENDLEQAIRKYPTTRLGDEFASDVGEFQSSLDGGLDDGLGL